MRKAAAVEFRLHLDRLIQISRGIGSLTPLDLQWIAELSPEIRQRLTECGLIESAKETSTSFIDHFDSYVSTMGRWKDSTHAVWRTARKRAFLYFAQRPMKDITAGHARDFKEFMLTTLELEENTARKTIQCCRQVCKWLIDHETITKNPFFGQPVGIGRAKDAGYVSPDVIDTVLEHCPDAEWRLAFIMSRWGGLRVPSELFQMRWADIDWAVEQILIRSSKTAHHDGKDQRTMPLFPDLRERLWPTWNALPERCPEWLTPRLRNGSGSMHAQATKILIRAQVDVWPRLFHNLRASRLTDLSAFHGMYAVSSWLGNSTTIATKHYARITPDLVETAKRVDVTKLLTEGKK